MSYRTPNGRTCVACGGPLIGGQVKYCSFPCQAEQRRARLGTLSLEIPRQTKGAIHELAVSADLLRRGYHVFRALSHACPCDLVIFKADGPILRVEVRQAHYDGDGQVAVWPSQKDKGRQDVMAYVTHDGEIVYFPDL